jgi:hypothetical protein
MTHRMRERNPNGQVKIKRRTHPKKTQQISNGYNNVKHIDIGWGEATRMDNTT